MLAFGAAGLVILATQRFSRLWSAAIEVVLVDAIGLALLFSPHIARLSGRCPGKISPLTKRPALLPLPH